MEGVMVAAEIAREREGQSGVLPTAEQERRFSF
jgi:hypothetical protein